MSVMSNVREESLESSVDSMPILADTHYSSDDLTLPEDLRWRPAQAGSAAAKPFRQKSGANWVDSLYILLALASVIVCVSQLLWSVSW